MSSWNLVGQVAKINEKPNCWMIDVVENKYDNIKKVKEYMIWFNIICNFKPNCEVGDTIIVNGQFEPSRNKNFNFAMVVNHLGVISKSNSKTN